MKEMTKKDVVQLGKDLNEAKVRVFLKYEFTTSEIAAVMGIAESSVRRIIERINVLKTSIN